MPEELTLDSVVAVAPGHVSSTLEGEEVILSLEAGTYYGLNEVGARIWSLLKEPCSVGQVCEVILAEYEVEPAQCQQDVLALLSQLADAQLIRISDASGSDAAAPNDQ